jgi:CPA1 family monovalent cation:H+ antiporter
MITFVLAYSAFIIAESLHVSGVISVVIAGLLIGNYGTRFAMSPTTRMSIIGFWEVVVFIVNSVIFILIGASIPLHGFLQYGSMTLVAISLVIIARSVSVYLISNLTDFMKEKTPWPWQHVINWGGLRGSIPVALVLGIQTIDMPYKELITYISFGVVFFSLVVQGLTMAPLIKKLKIIQVDEDQVKAEKILAQKAGIKKALNELKEVYDIGEISGYVYGDLSRKYKEKLVKLEETHIKHLQTKKAIHKKQKDYAKKKGLIAEKSAIHDQLQKGLVSEDAGNELLKEIDAKLDLLG